MSVPIPIIIKGARGRLGQHVLKQVLDADDLSLVAACVQSDRAPMQWHHERLEGNYTTSLLASETLPTDGVLIDVSSDVEALDVHAFCRTHRYALVSGVTGISAEQLQKLRELSQHVPVMHTANFSVGVAVLKHLLAQASKALGPDFQLGIFDLHHQHKRDVPSGTALALEAASGGSAAHADLRLAEIIGEHTAFLISPHERLELTHRAHDRALLRFGQRGHGDKRRSTAEVTRALTARAGNAYRKF